VELEKVKYFSENQVGYIVMDYQQNLNAIDETMATELLRALDAMEEDETVKVIVVKGTGRAFSSGGDIRYFYGKVKSGEEIDLTRLANLVGQLTLRMKRSKKLVITAVNGVAAGAGANFALSGDFVIAVEKASFLESFASVGLVPDTGGSFLLSKALSPQQIMKYCVLGEPLRAAEAKALGLVHDVVAPEDLDSAVDQLAQKLVSGPQVCYSNIKKQIYEACFREYEQYLQENEAPMENACARSGDFREGVCAFVEKRQAQFKGD
jgi:enoyl-CoA hydratase/carnithine racemase